MLGQTGMGKLLMSVWPSKLAANVAKKFKEKHCGSSNATLGLISSLTFIRVQVNAYSQTSVPSIWVVGDVTGGMNLTPVALMEGGTLAKTLFRMNPQNLITGTSQHPLNYAELPFSFSVPVPLPVSVQLRMPPFFLGINLESKAIMSSLGMIVRAKVVAVKTQEPWCHFAVSWWCQGTLSIETYV